MNLKIELTKYIAKVLDRGNDEKTLLNLKREMWENPRIKDQGGLRLTELGFNYLIMAEIRYHEIRFDEQLNYTNKLVIDMDNYIDCPWYMTNKNIYVFGERMALQLILFSGSMSKFTKAKNLSKKTA